MNGTYDTMQRVAATNSDMFDRIMQLEREIERYKNLADWFEVRADEEVQISKHWQGRYDKLLLEIEAEREAIVYTFRAALNSGTYGYALDNIAEKFMQDYIQEHDCPGDIKAGTPPAEPKEPGRNGGIPS